MKKSDMELNAQANNSILGRGLRALAFKAAGNSQIMSTAKSVVIQAEELCAPASCRKSGTIAL